MTNEEAIGRIQDHIQHHRIGKYPHLKLKEALDMAISALCSAPTGDLMTVEQLREMDGQPVWVHVIDHTVFSDKKDDFDGWGMCRKSWVRIWDEKRSDLIHIDYDFEDYGKEWLAYAYPPAHIDREAWTAQWVEDGQCDHKPYRVRNAEKWKKYKCSKCGYKAGRRTSQKYCPSCGKAMTQDAWAELEKRLMW